MGLSREKVSSAGTKRRSIRQVSYRQSHDTAKKMAPLLRVSNSILDLQYVRINRIVCSLAETVNLIFDHVLEPWRDFLWSRNWLARGALLCRLGGRLTHWLNRNLWCRSWVEGKV